MRERAPVEEIHTLRCTRAALAEGRAWGAQQLILKGDMVDRGTPDEYDLLGKVLAEAGLPAEAVPGNHEVKPYREVDHPEAFARLGLTVPDERLHTVDLPGLRVALVDSTTLDVNRPRLDHAVTAIGEALDGRPALVVLHHHLLRLPFSVALASGRARPARPPLPRRRGRRQPRGPRRERPHPSPRHPPPSPRGRHRDRFAQGPPGDLDRLRRLRGRAPPGRTPGGPAGCDPLDRALAPGRRWRLGPLVPGPPRPSVPHTRVASVAALTRGSSEQIRYLAFRGLRSRPTSPDVAVVERPRHCPAPRRSLPTATARLPGPVRSG